MWVREIKQDKSETREQSRRPEKLYSRWADSDGLSILNGVTMPSPHIRASVEVTTITPKHLQANMMLWPQSAWFTFRG